MFYDRKIKYFSYMENGEKVCSVGFIKLEVMDNSCNITLQLSGVSIADKVSRKVYLCSGDEKAELCEITFLQGKAGMTLCLHCDNLCGNISYDKLGKIWIPISSGKELLCVVADDVGEKQRKQACIKTSVDTVSKSIQRSDVQMHGVHELSKESIVSEDKVTIKDREKGAKESVAKEQAAEEERRKSTKKASVPLLDSKWEQLAAIYPHIKPFQDDREYLSMGPGDFVILSQKYYKLVNNSFLLHGYYNYKHLILTRVEKRGEVYYYIGVPGNFYEREKQVAIMFGFESFECLDEPAQDGDYGYYMMRVEL